MSYSCQENQNPLWANQHRAWWEVKCKTQGFWGLWNQSHERKRMVFMSDITELWQSNAFTPLWGKAWRGFIVSLPSPLDSVGDTWPNSCSPSLLTPAVHTLTESSYNSQIGYNAINFQSEFLNWNYIPVLLPKNNIQSTVSGILGLLNLWLPDESCFRVADGIHHVWLFLVGLSEHPGWPPPAPWQHTHTPYSDLFSALLCPAPCHKVWPLWMHFLASLDSSFLVGYGQGAH